MRLKERMEPSRKANHNVGWHTIAISRTHLLEATFSLFISYSSSSTYFTFYYQHMTANTWVLVSKHCEPACWSVKIYARNKFDIPCILKLSGTQDHTHIYIHNYCIISPFNIHIHVPNIDIHNYNMLICDSYWCVFTICDSQFTITCSSDVYACSWLISLLSVLVS